MAPKASKNIDLYIISDPNLNAFVQGGQNIFVHTGLLQKTKTPEQLAAGVLAHELGHITGIPSQQRCYVRSYDQSLFNVGCN